MAPFWLTIIQTTIENPTFIQVFRMGRFQGGFSLALDIPWERRPSDSANHIYWARTYHCWVNSQADGRFVPTISFEPEPLPGIYGPITELPTSAYPDAVRALTRMMRIHLQGIESDAHILVRGNHYPSERLEDAITFIENNPASLD